MRDGDEYTPERGAPERRQPFDRAPHTLGLLERADRDGGASRGGAITGQPIGVCLGHSSPSPSPGERTRRASLLNHPESPFCSSRVACNQTAITPARPNSPTSRVGSARSTTG